MDLKDKVGQMLVLGWQGETAEEHTQYCSHARTILEDWHVGGIVYFGRNVGDPEQVARLNNTFQSKSEIPLFVTVDQEGGWIARIREPATVFPGNMGLGATWSPKMVYQAMNAIGAELAAMGFNTDLAPCMDVNSNPDNPIIGVRSFGESPAMVGVMGVQAIKGLQDAGIIACAKHFPGHGDTSMDSHKQLPTIKGDRTRLDSIEMRPFRIAMDGGVEMIMTTHIIFPAIDPDFPATLSPRILTDLLRKEFGFDGLIITDCLEMRAIAHNYGVEQTAVLAVKAGVDLLAISHTLEIQGRMRQAIIEAVESGEIPESRIDESVERILRAKQKAGLYERRQVDAEAVTSIVGCEKHRSMERSIARKSITLVRDRNKLIPQAANLNEPVFVLGAHKAVDALKSEIARYANVLGVEALDDTHRNALCIIASTMAPECISVVARAREYTDRIILVGVEEPYEAGYFTEVGTYIAGYGFQRCTLEAVADLIFGQYEASGRLPVSIPDRSEAAANRAALDRTILPQ